MKETITIKVIDLTPFIKMPIELFLQRIERIYNESGKEAGRQWFEVTFDDCNVVREFLDKTEIMYHKSK